MTFITPIGLLPLLFGRLWFGLLGSSPWVYVAVTLGCDLLLAWGLARFVIALRAGLAAVVFLLLTLDFVARPTYLNLTHALEAALLVNALAEHARGRRGVALALLTTCAFVKPSMAYVYGACLLALTVADLARSPIVLALVLFTSLLWPTFFMGMSLPLLARTLTRRVETAAGMVGSLYGFNVLGAAVGALLTTWLFMRTLGFEATVQLGAVLNLFAAVGAILVAPYFLSDRTVPTEHARPELGTNEPAADPGLLPVSVWIAIYGLSGFIALSLDVVHNKCGEVVLTRDGVRIGRTNHAQGSASAQAAAAFRELHRSVGRAVRYAVRGAAAGL